MRHPVNDRFADAQAENLNVEIDYPLLESLASPCRLKSQRMAGILLESDRMRVEFDDEGRVRAIESETR